MDTTQFSTDDIQTLKELLPDWEEVWWRVVLLLCGADGESGALCHQAKKVCTRRKSIVPDSDISASDLVSFVLDYYYERLKKKTLLQSLIVEEKPVRDALVDFLTSTRYLSCLWKQRYKEDSIGSTTALTGNESTSGEEDDAEEFQIKHNELSGCLDALRIHCEEPFRRGHKYAGIQLYPRLDRQEQIVLKLCETVCAEVIPADNSTADDTLRKHHRESDDDIAAKIASTELQYQSVSKSWNPQKKIEAIDEQIADLYFQQIFCPLVAVRVAKLLTKTTREYADKLLSRYRKDLPELLPELQEYYKFFQEHRRATANTIIADDADDNEE